MSFLRRCRWRTLRTLRAPLARVVSFVVGIALLVAILRGGAGYFYCPATHLVMATSCCAQAQHKSDDGDEADRYEGAALDQLDCCEARRIGVVAPTPLPAPPQALGLSPMVAIVHPYDVAAVELSAAAVTRFAHPVRAGPPSALERRAVLMVFHS